MAKLKVGMVGLGKLGLPCLLAMEKHGGHSVYGFDNSLEVINQINLRNVSYWEADVNNYLAESRLELAGSAAELVSKCDIIFVAVPTPHEKEFEGSTPVPTVRRDFDYSHLVDAINDLAKGLDKFQNHNPLIVVISTVLPGTMREKVLPILESVKPNYRFAYNPYFIAMGTTIWDFLNPEFFLIGSQNREDAEFLERFYQFVDAQAFKMQIESAELTKVAYNTFIGFKIVFANAIAEITERRGGDADEVTGALIAAKHRIMSGKYFSAGMGDGGGCHPRDQIAMSWLAKELDLSFDIFDAIATARDSQTRSQAKLIAQVSESEKLPIVILGKAYKENSPLIIGSPAVLLTQFLKDLELSFEAYDPFVDEIEREFRLPSIFFIATKHDCFANLNLPDGSVLIDPWGYAKVSENNRVKVIQPGRKAN